MREAETDLGLHLDLIDADQLILDRILDGKGLAFRRVEGVERRVERGGLAAAGGAGHQDDAVRLIEQLGKGLVRRSGKPSAWKSSCTLERSRMRSTTLSPHSVGMVETRKSISRPCTVVLMRPSCGRRRSAMLSCAM